MKKLSQKQKNRQRRLTARRTLRHQRRAAERRRWVKPGYAYSARRHRKRERIRLRAPDVIDFYNPRCREATAKFLESLRTVTLLHGHRVRIDFSETKRVTAAATLAFLAEIDRIHRYLEEEGIVRCVPPVDAVVSQVFQQIGLAKLIGIDRQVTINHDQVRCWQFITNTTTDGDATGHILERLKDQSGTTRSGLDLTDLGVGAAFGSTRQEVMELNAAGIDDVPIAVQQDVLAFDWWVRNEDRILTEHGGNPNLFWNPGARELVVIDHNQAFDPMFEPEHFLNFHVFRKQMPFVFGDKIHRREYNQRFFSALEA